MEKDSVGQKTKHIPVEDGKLVQKSGFPYSQSDVVHLFNFNDLANKNEVLGLVKAVLDGAEQAGLNDGQGMLFLLD